MQRYHKRLLLCSIAMLSIATLMTIPAFASAAEAKAAFQVGFNVIRGVANAIAVVGLAFSVIQFFLTEGMSEKSMEALKHRIMIIVLTIAAINLLPAFLQLGLGIGQQLAWSP